MNELVYTLELRAPNATFADPPAITGAASGFDVRLENGRVTVSMRDSYATVQGARDAVDPFLRAWESSALLEGREIAFYFERALGTGLDDGATVRLSATPSGVDHHEIGLYPKPPVDFAVDMHVEALLGHFRAYRAGQERRADYAYAVFTYITNVVSHGVDAASSILVVSGPVLRKLSELSTNVGEVSSVRKFGRQWSNRPFTQAEIEWLDTVTIQLIRRVGALAAGASGTLSQLTMADLPPL